jgi:Protein of unknown function (DUF3710)
VFRRRGRTEEPADETSVQDAAEVGEDTLEPAAGDDGVDTGSRASGPWDLSEVGETDEPQLDLGALRVPARAGMEIRVDVAEGRVTAATMVLGGSALQVQPFAAPRTLGIWEEIRAEIAARVTRDGGTADEVTGAFGPELRAQVQVRLSDGRSGIQPARFVGVDGPRWFLRGVFTGDAVTDADAAAPLEEVLRSLVVVRGDAPMPPREPLPLRLPGEQATEETPPAEGSVPLDPFRRGPEITEVR